MAAAEENLSLPDDPETLKAMIRELLAQLRDSRRHESQLQEKVAELLHNLFGRKSEKIDPNQLSLIDLESLGLPAAVALPEPPPAPPAAPARKGHGRRRPPRELPRRRIVHEVPEAERLCPCCGESMQVIREELSEQLDYQPASLYVTEHVRPIYACRKGCAEAPVIAPKPPQPIDKGLPGAGLLAHVVVSKYCDHLPLYRQEGIFRRQGVELARSTLCGWVGEVAATVAPVIDRLKQDLLASELIATDDTTVPVLDPRQKQTAKGRLWVYLGDEQHPGVSSTTRRPTSAPDRRRFSTAMPATCRPTPTTATTASSPAAGWSRSVVGCTHGATSSRLRRPTRRGRVRRWR